MSGLRKLGWSLVLLVGLLMAGVNQSQAADTYDISRYHMFINVNADGSADVEQQMGFEITDQINGVYLNQDLKTATGRQKKLTQPQISVNDVGFEFDRDADDVGLDDTYSLKKMADQYQFKLYRPANDDDHLAISMKYRIENLIINYQDTAELNWRVIGSAWDSDLKNVKVVVQLPQKLAKNELKSWTHGPLDGQQTVEPNKGRVTITLAHNPENQFVESHIIFPTRITPDNPNVIHKKQRATIIAKEAKLAKAANRRREMRRQGRWIIAILMNVLALGLIWRLIRKVNRTLPPLNYTGHAPEHVYELPDDNGPAVVRYLLMLPFGEKPKENSLSATILDLVARRHISIEPIAEPKDGFHKAKPNFRLTLINQVGLSTSEKNLVNWLFNQIGSNHQVTLREIERSPKTSSVATFRKYYASWQDAVKAEAEQAGWLREHALELNASITGWLFGALALAGITIGGIIMGFIFWWAIVGPVILMLVALRLKFRIRLWTQLGFTKMGEWFGFKQMLKDISTLDMSEVGDVVLWDRYLSFATVFGIADKVAKALEVQLTPEQIQTMPLGYYYYGFAGNGSFGNAFNTALTTSVSTAFSAANTSSSGGSGGFSGGSSGGFGGGSGGGTF